MHNTSYATRLVILVGDLPKVSICIQSLKKGYYIMNFRQNIKLLEILIFNVSDYTVPSEELFPLKF